jgi:glycosyltransferase involved in cell wall biosynthesis
MGTDFKILVYPGWKEANYYKLLYKEIPNVEYASYSGAIFTLLKNKKLHQPSAIHLHWLTSYFAVDKPWSINFIVRYLISLLDLLIIRFFTQTKMVWTVHNLYEHETKHEKLEVFAKWLTSKLVHKIIVLGASAKSLVAEEYGANQAKIETSLHGHFNGVFPTHTLSKKECRTLLDLPSDKLIYLFPGAAKDYKGIVELVSAFVEWKNENATLVIAGKIAPLVLLKFGNLPNNIIIRNHFVSDEEMPKYFNAADWVVIPYKRILTSATVLTAMGLGAAIIVPNTGTLGDYLDENGGILYPQNEKDCLLSALQKSTRLDHTLLGTYNRSKALTFDWKLISNQTYEILRNA